MFEFSVVVSRFRTGDVYFVNITVKIFFVLVFRYLYQQRFDLEVESWRALLDFSSSPRSHFVSQNWWDGFVSACQIHDGLFFVSNFWEEPLRRFVNVLQLKLGWIFEACEMILRAFWTWWWLLGETNLWRGRNFLLIKPVELLRERWNAWHGRVFRAHVKARKLMLAWNG